MKLIGIAGGIGAGKDAAVGTLVVSFNFRRVAFADKVREFLYILNPSLQDGQRIQTIIDKHSWNGYKQTEYNDEIRGLLQRLGTDCGRDMVSPNIWINMAFKSFNSDSSVAISDVRFPNEARAIVDFGGEVWKIDRPGNNPSNTKHKSEGALNNWPFDLIITNEGTLDEFKDKVRTIYRQRFDKV